MIGRRTVVGLSLLCALMFSAIAVQSASAAKAVNTTAVTCVEGGTKDFSDAHCDTKVAAGTGKFGHAAIANDTTTEIEVDNSETGGVKDPAVLAGKAFGAATEITCTGVSGTGTLHNVESSGKHTVTGTVTVNYTGCTVNKPAKCIVAEPIVVKAIAEGVEGLAPEGKGMGVEFGPDESKNFTQITFKNKGAESCSLNEKTLNVEGSATATGIPASTEKHSGATADFDHAKNTALGKLLFGGVAAGFENTGTVKMKGGGPIALTTTT